MGGYAVENNPMQGYELKQNMPNPSDESTTIEFTIPISNMTELSIFDTKGNKIKTIISTYLFAGTHTFEVNLAGIPSGIYYYTLQSGDFSMTNKMIVVK